jgi:hypothetical protein
MIKRLKLTLIMIWGIGGFIWLFGSGMANSDDAPYALAFMAIPMLVALISWIVTGENKLEKWFDL